MNFNFKNFKQIEKMLVFCMAALILFSHSAVYADKEDEGEAALNLPIVMYHHITKEYSICNDYVLLIDDFESDLKYLKENGFTSISLQNLFDWYNGNFEMPEKPFMITFDDGYESTAVYAQPLLEKYGFCAVVAIIGAVTQLHTEYDEHNPAYSHLSWDEVRDMARCDNMEVQCHTWDMHNLSPRKGCSKRYCEGEYEYRLNLSEDLSKYLTECEKHEIDTKLGIAYPFGEFSKITTEIVKDMGFLAAFTCSERINKLTGDEEELFHLARFNRAHGLSSENFFEKW